MKKIRTVLVGYVHPHYIAILRSLCRYPDDFEIIAFADVPPADLESHDKTRAKIFSMVPGITEYENWQELIELKPDFAVVCSDNSSRGDVCCELLEHGIAVMDEKPMAMTGDDARRICLTAKKNNTPVFTNWPIAWFPPFRMAKKLLDEGRIGKLMRVTYRSPATWGPFSYSKDGSLPSEERMSSSWWYHKDRGGGSLLDYACYGTMLGVWMFGKAPVKVQGIAKAFTTADFSDVEDYSAMLLDFGDGVGLLEGSWSTFNVGEVPTGPVLYGTEGVIVCDRHSGVLKLYTGRSHNPVAPTEIIELDADRQTELLGAHIARVLRGEEAQDIVLSAEFNYAVSAALDAGRISAETGAAAYVAPLDY